MISKLNEHILKDFPFLAKSKLLIAISGGIDSVVLVHSLHTLGYQIALAHVNFQLRGAESDKDVNFINALAQELQIPVFIHKMDTNAYAVTNKVSIQMAAREIRYTWFERILEEKKYDYVLTAHHLDDSIETFFINLNRSAGLDGLTGIPQQNSKIIRPLLPFLRDQIVAYAKQNKLSWREDASNASTKYLRNKIRHDLIPILMDINPEFKKAFLASQKHLKKSQSLVHDYISIVKPTVWKESDDLIYISLKEILSLPNPDPVLYELLKEYGFTQWDDVYDLVQAQSGKQVFSPTHFLLKDREYLILGVINIEKREKTREKRQIGDKFEIQNSEFRIETVAVEEFDSRLNNTEYIDKSKINFPLFVRKWQEGDYFYPLGMEGRKKISDFLIDQKIAQIEKEKIWLLCDSNDNIIWVIGKRLDNRFKITKNTTEVLKITPQNE